MKRPQREKTREREDQNGGKRENTRERQRRSGEKVKTPERERERIPERRWGEAGPVGRREIRPQKKKKEGEDPRGRERRS